MSATRIFLSYRDALSSPVVGRLYERLAARFPNAEIVDAAWAMTDGDDLAAVAASASSSTVLVALIDEHWRVQSGADGHIEVEIVAALGAGVTVVPVLVDGAELPASSMLPDALGVLLTAPHQRLRRRRFQSDIDILLASIEGIMATEVGGRFDDLPDFGVPWLPPEPARRRALIFVSYSHRDGYWLERLQTHLRPLTRQGRVELWDDTQIRIGDEWRQEIRRALETCSVAILLVSADFMASDFIFNDEMPSLLDGARGRGVRVLPIVASSSSFADSDLARFQAVNTPDKPLDTLSRGEQEAVLEAVHKSIRSVLTA